MREARPSEPASQHGRRGAVPIKHIAVTAVVVFLVVGVGYTVFSGSAEDLLDQETLTPGEIQRVAEELLLHDDLQIRTRASEKLAAQGETAIPVLKDVGLSTSDSELRMAVFAVLAPMHAESAAEILEAMMDDDDPHIRQRAAKAASQLRTPRAVAVLEKGLADSHTGIRSSVAGLIGPAGIREVIPALKKALNDPERSVRKHAARSLEDLTGQDYSAAVD